MVLRSREFLREGLQWEYPYGESFLVGKAGEMSSKRSGGSHKVRGERKFPRGDHTGWGVPLGDRIVACEQALCLGKK